MTTILDKAAFVPLEKDSGWSILKDGDSIKKTVEVTKVSDNTQVVTKSDNYVNGKGLTNFTATEIFNSLGELDVSSLEVTTCSICEYGAIEELLEAIEESRSMLELKENFDGEGFRPIEHSTWEKMKSFLLDKYAPYVKKRNGSIFIPDIYESDDGNIELLFENDNFYLSISIWASDIKPTFYADNKKLGKDRDCIKGFVNEFSTSIFDWILMYIYEQKKC